MTLSKNDFFHKNLIIGIGTCTVLIIIGTYLFFSYKQKHAEFLFNKKVECQSLEKTIIENLSIKYEKFKKDSPPTYESYPPLFDSVFYNKKRNTCLYRVNEKESDSFCDGYVNKSFVDDCKMWGITSIKDYYSDALIVNTMVLSDFKNACKEKLEEQDPYGVMAALKIDCNYKKNFNGLVEDLRNGNL